MSEIDFSQYAEEVAKKLFGEPNKKMSKGSELRFGSKGSISVDIKKGQYFDHQEGEGGGVIAMIQSHFQYDEPGQAVKWMRDEMNIDIPDGAKEHGHKPRNETKPFVPDDGPPPIDEYPDNYDDSGAPDRYEDHFPPEQEYESSQNEPESNADPVISKTYDYVDIDGELLYQVCRMEPKSFRQRRPDKSKPDGWNWSAKGVTHVPYRLPELLEAVDMGLQIFIVEGEKDVDLLIENGIAATCNAGGAGKFPDSMLQYFKGVKVVLVPDDDPQTKTKDGRLQFHKDGRPKYAGIDHMDLVGEKLKGIAESVDVMTLEHSVPLDKRDPYDWFKLDDHDARDWFEIAGEAVPWVKPFNSKFNAIPWANLDDPGPEHEWLIKNMITRHETSALAGPSQSGKSFVSLDASLAIARGEDWFGHRTVKGGVIYQAGEGSLGLKKRLRAYRQENPDIGKDLPFVLLPGSVDLHNSDKDRDDLIREVKHWQEKFDVPLELIVIDTLSAATPGANENTSEDMSRVLSRLQEVREVCNCAIMVVHHMNAEGSKLRGHTSIFANLDSIVQVNKVEAHRDNDNLEIREMKVTKQKDGEAGVAHRFVLPEIKIGIDADGDAITSCVIARPNGGDVSPQSETSKTKHRRKQLTGNNSLMYISTVETIDQFGIDPPLNMASSTTIPEGAKVATMDQVIRQYEPKGVWDGKDPEALMKKSAATAIINLQTAGVIGFHNPYIWSTGMPVKDMSLPKGQKMKWGDEDNKEGNNEELDNLNTEATDELPL